MSKTALGVRELIGLAEAGEVTLPTEVTTAWNMHLKVLNLSFAPPPVLHPDSAAHLILEDLRSGKDVDLTEVAREVEAGTSSQHLGSIASNVLRIARESAADAALIAVRDPADEIIKNHLRPAFLEVLGAARELAPALGGGHDWGHLELELSNSERANAAREALSALQPLGVRRVALVRARNVVNRLGNRTPEHDEQDLFATLRKPQALAPHWEPGRGSRLPYPAIPEDPTRTLLWCVTEGEPAEPWLPTVSEQDEAYLEVFGELLAKRRAANASWGSVMAH